MKRALVVVSLVSRVLACTPPEVGPEKPAPGQPAPERPAPERPAPEKRAPGQLAIAKDDEAALAVAVKAAGGEFNEHDCGGWPPSFPRVVVAGAFKHDRGCEVSGMLVDGVWLTQSGEVAGLQTRGFAGASPEDKQTLARAWVDEVVHGFGGRFVRAPELAFKVADVAFTPVAVRMAGPEVVVEGWTREPSGMRYESAYELKTYRFAADGKLSVAGTQRFAVAGPLLEAAEAAERTGQVGSER